MNKTDSMKKMTRVFYKTGFEIKKYSPEILAATGVIGVVTSCVLACKATTKVSDILTDIKKEINDVHMVSVAAGIEENNDRYDDEELFALSEHEKVKNFTIEDSKRNLAAAYMHAGIKFAKLYSPAIILGTLSIGCLLTSNNILQKRNLALATAYAAVDKGFKEYRSRVIERFGEDVDKELRYNIQKKEVTEVVVDDKGKEKTVKKKVDVIDPNSISPFARFFDETSTEWVKDAELNLMTLRQRESYANDLLVNRGYLFLNEVYDMLGILKTADGQVVGWLYDPDDKTRDSYVDFGIYNGNIEKNRDFVNGYERSILINPNVDGYILDKLKGSDIGR